MPPDKRMQPTHPPVIKFAYANWPPVWRAADAAGSWPGYAPRREVFGGPHFSCLGLRRDDGEARFITVGWLDNRLVVMA